MYKAVISDLDGTLLNEKGKVSDFTRETVKELIDKGIKFYIATGRNYGLVKAVMDELGITIPLISANGARINDENGKVVFEAKETWRPPCWAPAPTPPSTTARQTTPKA